MGKTASNPTGALAGLIPALPLLDIALTSMVIGSIRDGRPETGLFAIFYIQMAVTDILVRALVYMIRKNIVYRWYYWASWICRWALILMAVLSSAHLIETGAFEALVIPYIYHSRRWTGMAIVPLRWISSLCGAVLILGRKETRRRALKICLIGVPVSLILVGIVSDTLDQHPTLANYIANIVFLWIPRMFAPGGALFDPVYGKKIREEEKAEEEEKRRREAAAQALNAGGRVQSSSRPVSGSSPAPSGNVKENDRRTVEKRLADEKAAYEARMRRQQMAEKSAGEEALSFDEDFGNTAVRLYSEGQAAASLGGQRQLVYWMTSAVPGLRRLPRKRIGKAFYAPSLQDDPEVFLPVLEELLSEAIRLLETRGAAEDGYAGYTASPDELCAGWYALTRYAAITKNTALTDEAERLKTYFRKDKACMAWLREINGSVERGTDDGSGNPAEIHSANHYDQQ